MRMQAGRLRATLEYRPDGGVFGRFGGGWRWKLGIMIGGRTMVVDMLVASLRIEVLSKGWEATR